MAKFNLLQWFMLGILLGFSVVAYGDNTIEIIKITPEQHSMTPGQKHRFVAKAYDSQDKEVTFTPEWQATGGSVTQEGVYIAGNNTGIYSVMATSKETGARGTATVRIRSESPNINKTTARNKTQKLVLIPKSVELSPGEKVRFKVRAFNSQGDRVRTGKLIWRVSGGSVTPDGEYQAGGAPGKYYVLVKQPNGAKTRAEVVIKGLMDKILRVKITPTSVTLKPLQKKRFFATGYNGAGNVVRFTPRWEATGGWIDRNGIFYAGKRPGNYAVKAIAPEGASSTATIIVEKVKIDTVKLYPEGAFLVPEQIEKFTVTALDYKGQEIEVQPLWSATGGIIKPDGTYQAGSRPGKYKLHVTVENVSITADIIIKEGNKPVELRLAPDKVTIQPGETVLFKASAHDQAGVQVPATAVFLCTGGTVTREGKYTAGKTLGRYILKAKTAGGLTAEAQIEIVREGNAKKVKTLVIRPKRVELPPNGQTVFRADAYDNNKNKVPILVQWQTTGGGEMLQSTYKAGAKEGTFFVIATTRNGTKAVATIVIDKNAGKNTKKSRYVLKVNPPTVDLKSGQRCIFNIEVFDAKGKAVPHGKLKWRATGGKISADGMFVAGNTPGSYQLTVRDVQHKVEKSIPITIYEKSTGPTRLQPFQNAKLQAEDIIIMNRWNIGTDKKGFRKINIEGIVRSPNATLIKFLRYRLDDSPQVLYQSDTHKGERYRINGDLYLPNTKSLAFVLYDDQGRELFKKEESLGQ